MRRWIETIPVIGPLVAVLVKGVFVGMIVVHVDGGDRTAPLIALNERLIAKVLHRQGRLIERNVK
jgi:hypothetical protein